MSKLRLTGSTSGYTELTAAAVSSNNTITLPSSNGVTGQLVKTLGSGVLDWSLLKESGSGGVLLGGSGGTAAEPSIAFNSDTDTGLYSPGANQLALATGGSGRLFINSSGQIGIGGITTPEATLDLGSGTLRIKNNSTDSSGLLIYQDTSDTSKIYNYYNGPLLFGTNNQERLRITSGGLVGIGTTASPSGSGVKLTIDGSSGGGIELVRANDGGGALLPSSGGGLQFFTHTGAVGSETYSERARIDSSGRLLVGTFNGRNIADAAQGSIQVETVNFGGISITNNRGDISGANLAFGKQRSGSVGGTTIVQSDDGLGAILFGGADGTDLETQGARIEAAVDGTPGTNDMPGRLVFSTTADGASSPTERMRIQSNGVITFGPSTNISPAVSGVEGISIDSVNNYVAVVRGGYEAFAVGRLTSDGAAVRFYRNSTNVGDISVTTIATAYNTSSDYRLKENVVPLTGAVDRLNQLQVHRFNFIADPDRTVDGFIAHEAQAVVPECVTGEKDAIGDDGKPVYQGIDQSKLVPLLTAALQEALAEIESLKARLTAAGI